MISMEFVYPEDRLRIFNQMYWTIYGDKPMEWRRGLYLTQDHCYLNELG